MAEQNKEKSTARKWTRRAFLGFGGLVGVGLVAGVGGFMYAKSAVRKYSGKGLGDGDSLNAWIRIAPDNTVTLAVPRAEMGQGVYTALPQMLAEELEVDMSQIKVIHPQPESPYTNNLVVTQDNPNIFKAYTAKETLYSFLPIVVTGGSTSIADGWNNMRYAGATAREMLIQTAAKRWDVKPTDCYAKSGQVINKKSNEKFKYGELAEEAATIEVKELPQLKNRKDYKVIGKPVARIDIPQKVTGEATFGLDVRLDNMLFAAVRHPKTIGGTISKIKNEDEILKMNGVKKVFITEYGVAIAIADNTWRAINAARSLDTEEDNANADISTESLKAEMIRKLDEDPIAIRVDEGDALGELEKESGKIVEGRYHVPYLAHATMEPMNCTVLVKDGKCEAWVGHQGASIVHNLLNESTGIAKADTFINITYLGGGFGRRSEPDFVRFAGAAAKEMPGIPIQTVFSREEDMRNDPYRPMATCNLKAKVNDNGDIEAFNSMSVLQSCQNSAIKRIMPLMATPPEKDQSTVEGIEDLPYAMNNKRVAFGNMDLPIQIGFWRSVGYSQNSFFAESFMDECAHAVGKDPYQFRKSKLGKHPRHEAVLDKAADMSGWSTALGENKFRGIALVKSFGSIVAQVAEITKVGDKEFKIDKYHCAIDCGNVVNPSIVESQVRGGLIYGLTAALYGEITWKDGAVEQSNFPQYEMVRLNVCPQIDVHIMDIDEYPGGVGEPGTPPAAPALANAIFAATGERVRSLPFTKSGYKFV